MATTTMDYEAANGDRYEGSPPACLTTQDAFVFSFRASHPPAEHASIKFMLIKVLM